MLDGMASMPYLWRMKMTMHIDEATLHEVMKITGIKSKTRAVETALFDLVRRHKLKTILKAGMGLTSEEIRDSYDFSAEDSLKAAETPPTYNGR